ncbi:zinc-binding dehydrogenase [Pyxidicoccus parkwayensis]|uniref:Zinc-binding dehydrogenase n=1 Tax=Pyxidicoccus parkwayensis TaxID=2813578 RepID=A0ABX7NRR4_9BACT|nr:zinc-binding dehydrogenase [Pyxidicoccus parkwaysis]QSQ21393.1 zinc-binding dehydrogenase [Pyxidicoccus parkwaysis]
MAEPMRAVVTEPTATPRLAVREVASPHPAPHQALIRVTAFSLNAGETRTALAASTRYTPGWDFAGVVEQAAADGSSPRAGTRVFGVVPQGAWAEYVAARAGHIAEIPEGVTDAQAAALPVAGVTALVCLEEAGSLLGRRVLITGAAGGVGRFACQLAALAGATVFAVSRRPELRRQLHEDGVQPAGVFTTMEEAKAAGTYDVILDSVGGDTLGVALTALSFGGICVNCGNSAQQPTTFDARDFYLKSNGRLHGVWLGRELAGNCTPMLARLASLVKQGRLRTPIDTELPWTRVAEAADRLMQQGVDGKVILAVA